MKKANATQKNKDIAVSAVFATTIGQALVFTDWLIGTPANIKAQVESYCNQGFRVVSGTLFLKNEEERAFTSFSQLVDLLKEDNEFGNSMAA